jgi:hypothetical protein
MRSRKEPNHAKFSSLKNDISALEEEQRDQWDVQLGASRLPSTPWAQPIFICAHILMSVVYQ